MRKSAVSIVKHSENEKSITKTKKNTIQLTFPIFDVHVHCFLCLKRAKGRGGAVPRQRGCFYEKVGCFYCKTR